MRLTLGASSIIVEEPQNNVNLNRNFALDPSIFDTPNKSYEDLKHFLEIRKPIKNDLSIPAIPLLKKIAFEKETTTQTLTEAIGSGQFTSPTGINYGGNDFEPQTRSVIELFKKITPNYQNIFHIDFHTGLGDNGVLNIMLSASMNKKSKQALKTLFPSSDKHSQYEVIYQDNKEGFYQMIGDHAEILAKINPQTSKIVIGITAEFGTVGRGLLGKVKTINRLIKENRGHFAGYANEKVQTSVQQRYLELFNPSSKKWRLKVMNKGYFLMDKVTNRFINLPKE